MEHPAADHLDHPVIEHLKKEFGGVLDGPVTRNANEVYMTVTKEALPWVCEYLHHQLSAPLATIVGTDERQIDGTFKLSYVFSLDKADLFVVVRAALGETLPEGIGLSLKGRQYRVIPSSTSRTSYSLST